MTFPRVTARDLRARGGQSGLSMVELMVSLSLVGIVVVAFTSALAGALDGITSARTTVQASALSRRAIESARAMGWDGLAHLPGAVSADPAVVAGRFDPDGAGPLVSEEVVSSPTGLLDPYVATAWQNGVRFEVRSYVSWASGIPARSLKRITAVATWTDGGRLRTASTGTLVHPRSALAGAAAHVACGDFAGHDVECVAYSQAQASGETQTNEALRVDPAPGISGAGASTIASVVAGPEARAQSTVQSLSLAAGSLTLTMRDVTVTARSSRGGIAASSSGSVTINGVSYGDPAPGTTVVAGIWTITLNHQETRNDGSLAVTFARVRNGSTGETLALVWAWVRPVVSLSA